MEYTIHSYQGVSWDVIKQVVSSSRWYTTRSLMVYLKYDSVRDFKKTYMCTCKAHVH